jgi:hypothetical protein
LSVTTATTGVNSFDLLVAKSNGVSLFKVDGLGKTTIASGGLDVGGGVSISSGGLNVAGVGATVVSGGLVVTDGGSSITQSHTSSSGLTVHTSSTSYSGSVLSVTTATTGVNSFDLLVAKSNGVSLFKVDGLGDVYIGSTTSSSSWSSGALRVAGGLGVGGDIYAQNSIYYGSSTLATSDRRLKRNVEPIEGSREIINNLRPVSKHFHFSCGMCCRYF